MKKMMSLFLVGTFLLALVPAPAVGGDESVSSSPLSPQVATDITPHRDPPGELMIADAVFLRPVGFVTMIIGAAAVVPFGWLFATTSKSWGPWGRELIVKPFEYTFVRPLGEVDWQGQADPTW